MNAHAQNLNSDLLNVLEYPLVKIGDSNVTLSSLIVFVVVIALVFLLELLFRRYLIRRFLQRTHLHASMQYAVGKIAGYLFIAVGFYVALKLIGIDLSSLAFVAGAMGVGLGFGLQNIISNFVSGLIILAERPISIGDRVELGEVSGVVAKINLRSTNIVTNDNITIIVPNSDFITNKVINWSYGDPKVRIWVPVGVAARNTFFSERVFRIGATKCWRVHKSKIFQVNARKLWGVHPMSLFCERCPVSEW